MKITVKIYEKGNLIADRLFDEGTYRIGRSDFADIVLSHDAVSRSHLELRVTDANIYVTNMSGSGRLKVNGRAVETGEISDGDEVIIGPFKIVFYAGEVLDTPRGGSLALVPNFDGDSPNNLPNEGDSEEPAPDAGENGIPDYNSSPEENPAGFGDNQNGGFGENNGGPLGNAEGTGGALAEAVQATSRDAASFRSDTQVDARAIVAKLLFTEGPRKGEEIPVQSYEITLGRSKKADIFLDDEKLSRVHAKIARVGTGYRLIDLNSRHGTYVNGMRVLEHPLSSFDEIAIGKSKIKFFISDMMANVMGGGKLAPIGATGAFNGNAAVAQNYEATRSMHIDALPEDVLMDLRGPDAPPPAYPNDFSDSMSAEPGPQKSKFRNLLIGAVAALLLLYAVMPSSDNKVKPKAETAASGINPVDKTTEIVKLPASMPKEYAELSPEVQRLLEGHYNSAQKAAEDGAYEDAVGHLRKIHEFLPYYKQSRELQDQFQKKLKEKQIAEAEEKSKSSAKVDLQQYLDDGKEYLKEGDFERAAEAFTSAVTIDPSNDFAIKGLKAAQAKVRSVEEIPPEKDPEDDKRKLIADLFQQAMAAFTSKGYQEAIDTAEKIRQIEIKGDTQYLNEAKQIIDRSRSLQKEEFEPFLIQAKEKYAEGDYNASRDLCEEMTKRDANFEEAKECVFKAKKQLNRLAKEAYTHGYILESMNRIEEAKQYWNRAKNYVRKGDDYFDKVNKKLDYYQ